MVKADGMTDYVDEYMEFTNCNQNHTPELHIGLGANTQYTRPIGVCITSIAHNNPEIFLNFHIFLDLFLQADLERFQKTSMNFPNINIFLYKVDNANITHLPTRTIYPVATYYRLLMPLIIKDVDKILYIDPDIVCINSLNLLIKLNLDNKLAAVILDSESTAKQQEPRLNLQKGSYFNAGVLVINIPEWKKQDVTAQAIKLLADTQTYYSYLDQDVLNIVLNNKTIILPKSWNYIYKRKISRHVPPETVFIHYASFTKPWKECCPSETQFHWLRYEKISAWPEMQLELPQNYREARAYCRKLFYNHERGKFCVWLLKFIKMRQKEKRATRTSL